MNRAPSLIIPILALPALLVFQAPAVAGDTLTRAKARRNIQCGVNDGIPGLSLEESDNRRSGMEADFGMALAAAVLGDFGKAELVPPATSARFPP